MDGTHSFFHHQKALTNKTVLVAAWTAGWEFTTLSKQGGTSTEALCQKASFWGGKNRTTTNQKSNIHVGGVSY